MSVCVASNACFTATAYAVVSTRIDPYRAGATTRQVVEMFGVARAALHDYFTSTAYVENTLPLPVTR